MKIQTIFEAFEQFRLGIDIPTQLFSWISSGLQKVNYDLCHTFLNSKFSKVDHEDLPSKCKSVPNIDKIFLKQLEKQIARLKKYY